MPWQQALPPRRPFDERERKAIAEYIAEQGEKVGQRISRRGMLGRPGHEHSRRGTIDCLRNTIAQQTDQDLFSRTRILAHELKCQSNGPRHFLSRDTMRGGVHHLQ